MTIIFQKLNIVNNKFNYLDLNHLYEILYLMYSFSGPKLTITRISQLVVSFFNVSFNLSKYQFII
jgi:hypothetical protein